MRRREFISLLGGGVVAWPLVAHTQSVVRRIVYMSSGTQNDVQEQERLSILRDELRRFGWIETQNLKIESYWSVGSAERANEYVTELVANPPDVLVSATINAFVAMRRAGNTIPMVFLNLPDPVALGFVTNLAKPDGNFTGFTAYEFATAGKWLQMLKELAPRVERVAMIIGKASQPVGDKFYQALQAPAAAFGIETTPIPVDGAADAQAGIDAFGRQPNGGIVMAADRSSVSRAAVIDLAAKYRLPAIYPFRNIVSEGGLAFYGIDFDDLPRGAAAYVDRILRGAKPADLPIQAPTQFQLVINMKVAKALGLTISTALLARADELIE